MKRTAQRRHSQNAEPGFVSYPEAEGFESERAFAPAFSVEEAAGSAARRSGQSGAHQSGWRGIVGRLFARITDRGGVRGLERGERAEDFNPGSVAYARSRLREFESSVDDLNRSIQNLERIAKKWREADGPRARRRSIS